MMTKQRKIIILIVLVALGGGGFLAWRTLEKGDQEPVYTTTQVEKGRIISTVSTSGNLLQTNTFTVTTEVTGVVKSVLVKDSEPVEKGQKLIEITIDQSGEQAQTKVWSSYLSAKTAVASAAVFILTYIAYQFKEKMYGVCAILAMFHDTLILLGSFSLLGKFFGVEVDTLFVTAVLTTLSFSVHDTVVTYDSIRNAVKQNPKTKFSELINIAINQTLIRNLNNSLTIIFMLLALTLLGGPTIRFFSVALLIGTIAGTYSSTFIATPLLLVWKEGQTRLQLRKQSNPK